MIYYIDIIYISYYIYEIICHLYAVSIYIQISNYTASLCDCFAQVCGFFWAVGAGATNLNPKSTTLIFESKSQNTIINCIITNMLKVRRDRNDTGNIHPNYIYIHMPYDKVYKTSCATCMLDLRSTKTCSQISPLQGAIKVGPHDATILLLVAQLLGSSLGGCHVGHEDAELSKAVAWLVAAWLIQALHPEATA